MASSTPRHITSELKNHMLLSEFEKHIQVHNKQFVKICADSARLKIKADEQRNFEVTTRRS